MYLFVSNNHSPYYNLALEELLFDKRENDYLLIYRNDASVITGKHQNPYAETDIRFVSKNKMITARRLSGGGTVFHDQGNVNFSFIVNEPGIERQTFKKYSGYILNFLESIGFQAELNERNDIVTSDNMKISGNAQHINKNRLLHHGTLLFCSDLFLLKHSLNNPRSEKYKSHCIRSVKSKVANISDYCNLKDINEFQSGLIQFLSGQLSLTEYCFSNEDQKKILDFEKNKYSSKKWIFDYSPDYFIEINNKLIIRIQRGIITEINISVFSDDHLNKEIKNILHDKRHDFEETEENLKNSGLLSDNRINELLDLLF